jgi:hypothetical protein
MSKRLIRSTLAASIMALPIASMTTEIALASKDNFMVYNNRRAAIVELYVSASNRTVWDDNLLSNGQTVRSGEGTRIPFRDSASQDCLYDIKAVFSDERTIEDYQVNVCTTDSYTFN